MNEELTKEEAQARVDELNEELPNWFCPLINSQCEPACVCYIPAQVTTRTKYNNNNNRIVVFDVRLPNCCNAMFGGSN